MKEESTDKKEPMNNYKIIGQVFLVLALIFLLAAAVLEGDKEEIAIRLVLIIIGAFLTISGAILIWLPRMNKSTEKQR